ncbi:hypothetical protein L596_007598 [Steinernema carpocapsae]|uniref:Uncharacterized protein n=1 Tax=Steinernema carpocapsae TaxID=34508 RepID=A0A4U5PA69_STECR|nr:hypothetical protein L596_007598 [Steinernema carpocapsae]
MGNTCSSIVNQKREQMLGAKKSAEFGEPKKRRGADEKVAKIELNDSVVQEYITLEKGIYRLEKRNVLKKYESKTIFADNIKKTVDQLEATFKELKKQTEKEKADVDNIEQPSVKSFLKQQGTWENRYNKEQQDYLEALNRQEVAEKELRGSQQQYDRATKIADLYKQQTDKLNDLYEKQEKMLLGIFGPEYASEKENRLEGELDDAMEWQQRVSLAKFKWTNGRVLLVHAQTQMAFGITRWKELEGIDVSNTRMRYFAAAEARNNFIAAGQNVQSCRVYLGKVNFPYATEEEMAAMEVTVNSAFNDIQTDDSLKKALVVYQATHKKISSLVQWFDKVIADTILKDLDKANTDVVKKQKALRIERLALMKKQVKEQMGKDLKIDYNDFDADDDFEEELLALEADHVKDQKDLPGKDLNEILNLSQPEGRDPTPLPLSQLAPLPSKDQLFGDVKQKLDEYDNTRKAVERRQILQREKQQMILQEKLRLRQQKGRRTRNQRRNNAIVPLDDVEKVPNKEED